MEQSESNVNRIKKERGREKEDEKRNTKISLTERYIYVYIER